MAAKEEECLVMLDAPIVDFMMIVMKVDMSKYPIDRGQYRMPRSVFEKAVRHAQELKYQRFPTIVDLTELVNECKAKRKELKSQQS